MIDIILILNSIFVFIQIILISIFNFQSRKSKRNSQIIVAGISFGIVASFLSLLSELGVFIGSSRISLSLQLICFSLEYIILYIHFNYSVREKLDPLKISILGLFFGIFLVFSIKYMFESIVGLDELFWDTSYNILGFFSFLYITIVLFKSYLYSGEKETIIQGIGTFILLLGFVIGFIATPVIQHALHLDFEIFIADIVKAVGALLFISIFAFNVDFVERISVDTYGLLVFDSVGRELGYYDIKTKQNTESKAILIDPQLFVPLISALVSFTKEVLGTSYNMKSINVMNKSIFFEMGDTIHIALITERSSFLLNRSMKLFRKSVEVELMKDKITNFEAGIFNEKLVRDSIEVHFPYIEIV